jgi:hypothetical protein
MPFYCRAAQDLAWPHSSTGEVHSSPATRMPDGADISPHLQRRRSIQLQSRRRQRLSLLESPFQTGRRTCGVATEAMHAVWALTSQPHVGRSPYTGPTHQAVSKEGGDPGISRSANRVPLTPPARARDRQIVGWTANHVPKCKRGNGQVGMAGPEGGGPCDALSVPA